MLFLNLEWFRTPLTATKDKYILQTGNYERFEGNEKCMYLGMGLMRMKFHFDAPPSSRAEASGAVAPGFHINDISIYGYMSFKRS